MSDRNFEYFEDLKDYAFESSHAFNGSKIIGGLTILFITSGSGDIEAKDSYHYDTPIDKYELIDCRHPLTDRLMQSLSEFTIEEDDTAISKDKEINLKKLKDILCENGWSDMNSNQCKIAESLLKEISVLPIMESFIEFDHRSNTLFSVLSLPQDLRISFTRYLVDDGDEDLYFSVKGKNVILVSGALPANEFVKATLEAIAEVNSHA